MSHSYDPIKMVLDSRDIKTGTYGTVLVEDVISYILWIEGLRLAESFSTIPFVSGGSIGEIA